jgi:serine protease Do
LKIEENEGSVLQSISEAIVGVAQRVSPHVVRVASGAGMGTGVIWSKDGLVLTCEHVIGGAEEVGVTTADGVLHEGSVVGRDRDSDLALIKAQGDGYSPIELGDSTTLKVGEFVLAFANPGGKQPGLTSGIITSLQGNVGRWGGSLEGHLILTDARVNPGYSGGPLVDANGRMVGLDVAYFARRGVAIPSDDVRSLAEKLLKDGKVRRAFLGIVTEGIDLPEDVAARADVGQEGGMLVLSVEKDSPARKAGLALGDAILAIGDTRVEGHQDLKRALGDAAIGRPVELKVLRAESVIKMNVLPVEAAS